MSYTLLAAAHTLGVVLLGIAVAGIWLGGQRIRYAGEVGGLERAARQCETLEKRLLLPGVLLLLGSGSGLIVKYYGGWHFMRIPWLAAMVGLFILQSVWANTVTRRHALRLRRLLEVARRSGTITPQLDRVRADPLATFGQWLEVPVYALMVALGVLRPATWFLPVAGTAAAVLFAAVVAYGPGRPRALAPASSPSNASVEADGGTWRVAASTSRQRR